jgi:hypothetical protein
MPAQAKNKTLSKKYINNLKQKGLEAELKMQSVCIASTRP